MNKGEKNNKESFFSKYQSDPKYKAKIQLIVGGLFILVLVIWINVSNAIYSNDNSNLIDLINNEVENNNVVSTNDNSFVNKLKVNNYSYKLEINMDKEKKHDSIIYDGKIFNTSSYVSKTYNNVIEEYYIDKNNYYLKENNKFVLVNSNRYYSFVSNTFMELNTIINYINAGNLVSREEKDNLVISNYSIKLSEITLNNGDEYIEIKVTEDNNQDSIELNVNYTNLYKIYDNKIERLIVNYNIKDFNKIESFNIKTN